jgi:Transposase IS116/IS110/IS902 family
MSVFPTPKHLASWAKVSPGKDQSAGKRRSGKTGRGNKWLRATLNESANAAARTKDSYLCNAYAAVAATAKPSPPSVTQSSPPRGTCSKPEGCSATSAATTSSARTPTGSPNDSSANSKRSDTTVTLTSNDTPEPLAA